MPTVINNPAPREQGDGMGMGLILGIILAVVIGIVLFMMYGWPALQRTMNVPTTNQERQNGMNINVEVPDVNNDQQQNNNQNPTPTE
jgi:hypothetical protein